MAMLASPLIQVVIEKVADGLSGELRLLRGVHGDMERLKSILSTIKDVLDDAENKAIGEKSLCSWLKKLKDATYDADDVVDTFCTEALRQQIEYHDHFKRHLVRDFFSSQNPIIFSHRIARKLKHVLGRLDDIAEERLKYHLTHGSVSVRHVQPVETYAAVHESEILGRDEDKEKIVHFLINEQVDKDLAVLAVVGLGGIGKTALAQQVYNDDRVTPGQFFDLRIWICVSDVFDVKEIARKILQCLKIETPPNLELEPLSNLVRDTLSGKRFFLVLDNVWNEEPAKWESLQTLLRFGRSGSKIVTTTRNDVVANVMGSVSRYHLKGLSADDCWTLFSKRAFPVEKETANLTKIGKEIVGKCGGLPLAAKALGSLVSSTNEEFKWLAIRDSEIWHLTNENELLPALKLSYYHLPSHLKNCFVYCSLFPKDYVFGKKMLIRLWINEGFIPPSTNENISPEDAGNQCFDSLSWGSFFQDVKKYPNGFISCKMHDLVHDLACSIAKDEFHFTKYQKETQINDSCRYLSLLVDDKSPEILDVLFETKKLRSLILILPYRIEEVNPDVFVRLRNLRVLDLGGSKISVFPSTICRLKHLRFLDLSYAEIKVLPSSIGCLYNLQTLILSHCSNLTNLPNTITNLQNLHTLDVSYCGHLVELPRDIRKMKNLRHLDNRWCNKLSGMPMGMGQLTNLETLPVFIVGEEEGQHITELQQLNQIRGDLIINNLQKVTNPIEAREANLGAKTRVKSLCLEWGDERRDAAADVAAVEEEVIASLVPPPNLEWLKLRNYLGINYPSNWMIMSSCNSLETILLVGLRRCAYLPPLGQLPSLKILKISGMDAIRRIGEELYGEARGDKVPFHKLEELYMRDMKNLEEWVVEAGAGAGPGDIRRRRDVMFPCLTKLIIVDCPKLTWDVIREEANVESLVPLPNLESLELRNCLCINYPSWIMSSYNSLERIELVDLRRCAYLPPLGQLPSLKILKISGMDAIRRIGEEFYGEARGGKVPFCSLKRLYLYSMKNLEEWVVEAGAGAGPGVIRRRDVVMFPRLTKLKISNCPKLKRVHPSFPVSVVYLSIKGEVVLAAESLSGMNKLVNLEVSSTSSSSFWEGLPYLTALEKLTVMFDGDSETACLPEGLIHLHIPTLRTLEIRYFKGEALTTSIAAGLQQQPQPPPPPPPPLLFTSLHNLILFSCRSLTVLPEWVGDLTSLQGLVLSKFPKLEMLPDGLQHLTSLQQLTIDWCPILEKRCEREIGEDWHKIKHIPHIQIKEVW